MIQIDMPMPANCLDCPACNEYLTCAIPVDGRKWGENDVREFGQGRPEWCPMKEQEEKPMIENKHGWNCPSCRMKLIGKTASGYPCGLIDLPEDEPIHFCPKCGQAVKWDG